MGDSERFDRFIAIDWSGAATRPDLAVAEIDAEALRGGKWSWEEIQDCVVDMKSCRKEMLKYLKGKLGESQPRTLVMVDSGFAYPHGTAEAFLPKDKMEKSEETPWRQLVRHIGEMCGSKESPRAVGDDINSAFDDSDKPHHKGPFRNNKSRSAPDFYVKHHVGYLRQVEMLAPEALSQFWLGPFGAVGFSTISFMETLNSLMELRDGESDEQDKLEKPIDFEVWVHETFDASGDKHVLAETYPALFKTSFESDWPKVDPYQELTGHERDAVACLHWVRSLSDKELADFMEVGKCPVGRYTDTTSEEQLRFEGWILGVPWPQ